MFIFSNARKLFVAAVIAAAPLLASATPADWTLTQITGVWTWGNTQWDNVAIAGPVNNSTDLAVVDSLLHGPYVYSGSVNGPSNSIYSSHGGAGSLTFNVLGGQSTTLDSLSILSSRSYSTDTGISLDYSNNGGQTWLNALTTTTGNLGWKDLGNAGSTTEDIGLLFGGVSGNAFRFTTTAGDQINIHTLSLNTLNIAAVPEPQTYAMLLAGLGLMGFASKRRKTG